MSQGLAALAQQVAQDGFFDVDQVGGPGAELGLAQAFQGLDMAAHHAAHGIFGRVILFANKAFDFLDQRGVVHEQRMGGKDSPVLLAQLGVDGLLIYACFTGSRLEGLAQATTSSLRCFFSIKR